MFRWIVGSSLQFRFVVVGFAAVLVVYGIIQLQRMPVDVFPEFAAPIVEGQTEAIGLSAEEVESLITLNLEELLSGVPWLESIRSESVTGLSSIVLTSGYTAKRIVHPLCCRTRINFSIETNRGDKQ